MSKFKCGSIRGLSGFVRGVSLWRRSRVSHGDGVRVWASQRCPRRYLLGRKFPGQRIGPEPTTDRFTAVMYGEDDRTIPGNALTVAPNSPFRALQREGNAFLSRFEGSLCAAPLLEHLSLIDTPGVLSGEKQRVQRHYDFDVVVQ